MPHATDADRLLDALREIGDAMCAALDAEDFEGFHRLTETRGELLPALHEAARSGALRAHPRWLETVDAVMRQHDLIGQALARRRNELAEALGALGRIKQAHGAYQGPSARGGILRGGLSG